MPFLVYLVAIALAVGGVLIEVEWLVTSPPNPAPSKTTAATQSHAAAPAAVPPAPAPSTPAKTTPDLSPIYPASPGGGSAETRSDVAVAGTSESDNASDNGTRASDNSTRQSGGDARAAVASTERPVTPATVPQPSNRCDVRACASAYRSFRESDCTYQPYGGPRQLCDKAAVDRGLFRTREARFSPPAERGFDARAEATCNVATCSRYYSSFRVSDCSYQPYDGGPRRLCER